MLATRKGSGLAIAYSAPLAFAMALSALPTHRADRTAAPAMPTNSVTPMTAPVRVATPPLDDVVRGLESRRTTSVQHECLARTVYFEARGDSLKGQIAVAQVVVNRTRSEQFPDNPCKVMYQDGQFSFVHKGRTPEVLRDTPAWKRAVAVSRMVLNGGGRRIGGQALFFHATYVSPNWGRPLLGRIGAHIFYL